MTNESGAPNLDCMSADDAWSVWARIHGAPRRAAREMFPTQPAGYIRATRELGAYACNKATAMRCRARGDVMSAQIYESICDRIYGRLPGFARW